MRYAKIAGIVALFLAAAIPDASSGGAHAAAIEPGRVALTYEVYSGGFHLLTVDLDLAMAGERYDVTTRLQAAGFLSWFITWSQVSASEGTILNDAMAPVRHRSEGQVRGRKRTVEIDYDKGQASAVRVEPPPTDDEERDEVPLADAARGRRPDVGDPRRGSAAQRRARMRGPSARFRRPQTL